VIAGFVADLVGVDGDLERLRLAPARGKDVDIDGGAAADRDQQQLSRGEFLVIASAEQDPAAARIDRREPPGRDALDIQGSVRRFSRNMPTMPDADALALRQLARD
jgi:hypothetical protein